jgi:NADH-quinone oxidoreductase subunit N
MLSFLGYVISLSFALLFSKCEFLAVLFLLLYAGSVLLLFLFFSLLFSKFTSFNLPNFSSWTGALLLPAIAYGYVNLYPGGIKVPGASLSAGHNVFQLTLVKTNTYSVGHLLFTNYTEVIFLLGILLLIVMLGVIDCSSKIIRGLQFTNIALFNVKYKSSGHVVASLWFVGSVFNFKVILACLLLLFLVLSTGAVQLSIAPMLRDVVAINALMLLIPHSYCDFFYEKAVIAVVSTLTIFLLSCKGSLFTRMYIFGGYISSLFALCSYDVLTLVIALEVLSFCVILIINTGNASNARAISSVFNFFVLYSLNSLFLIVSSVYLCYSFGTTSVYNIGALSSVYGGTPFVYTAFSSAFVLSLLFKMSVGPFYFWAPGVVEIMPHQSLLFFLVFIKVTYFFTLVKLLALGTLGFTYSLSLLLKSFGIISIWVAVAYNAYTPYFKQYLVYSGASHMGFIVLALSLGSIGGLCSATAYFAFYLTALFLLLVLFKELNLNGAYISSLFGSVKGSGSHTKNLIGYIVIVLSGLPPFIGFFSKVLVLSNLIFVGDFFTLLIIGVSSTALVYTYLRVLYYLYFKQKNSFKLLAATSLVLPTTRLLYYVEFILFFVFSFGYFQFLLKIIVLMF